MQHNKLTHQTQSKEPYNAKLKEELNEKPIFNALQDSKKLAAYQVALKAEDAIDEMALVSMKKIDIDRCEVSLDLLIKNLLIRFEKLNNKFEDFEIPTIMDLIFKSYWYLSLEEIAYVFKKGISGDYKMPYNKLDVSTVMDWIHQYDSKERLAIAERRVYKKREEYQKLNGSFFTGVSKDFAKAMANKIALENGIDLEKDTPEARKTAENKYQQEKLKILSGRKKFIDENGNEIIKP